MVWLHENRDLNPFVTDLARRIAVSSFPALAPDGLTPFIGMAGFRYGSGVSNSMAVGLPSFAALRSFYGRRPKAAYVWKTRVPLLSHYQSPKSVI